MYEEHISSLGAIIAGGVLPLHNTHFFGTPQQGPLTADSLIVATAHTAGGPGLLFQRIVPRAHCRVTRKNLKVGRV